MITASIVTYKSNHNDLKKVIESINNSVIELIYIIDNSPADHLRDFINDLSPKINYIYGQGNIGYGSAHNIAIQRTINNDVKYHIILNPDIYFESGALNKLLDYINQNDDIGLIMPSIKYPDGRTQHLCKLLATPIDLIGRRFIPLKKWHEGRNNKYELHFTGYNKIMQVPSLSGCFMLLRTDVLEKIGGFDERFFMYCEDFDLCRRIGQVSKTIYYPEVSVIHNYEKGSYKNSKLLKYHIQSAFKYFNKWGWFFDKERRRINNETLYRLGYKK